MKQQPISVGLMVVVLAGVYAMPTPTPVRADAKPHLLMGLLEGELKYTMENLASPEGKRPYYLAYTVYEQENAVLVSTLGALVQRNVNRGRNLNIDLRVGDYSLDNTHQIRGGGAGRSRGSGNIPLALDDDPEAIRHQLWLHTDRQFKSALDRLSRIETNVKVKVEEDDQSDDFSREEASTYFEEPGRLDVDLEAWAERLRKVSAIAREFPLIYNSVVVLTGESTNRYMVTSEGTRLQTAHVGYRIVLQAATKAEDGMDLMQMADFSSLDPRGLPREREIEDAFRRVIRQVLELREAPLVEPYTGPAILRNRASGVFFHEIFGHRIEGHRQKDVTEGQTFSRKVNQPVLPDFISVYDDPTLKREGDIDLNGHYLFDDEGVESSKVALVEGGILKTFLLSRSPLKDFSKSNGHGRREPGRAVVSRQGNLVVKSSKAVSFERLRELLIEECKRQDKPFGLLFEDISGGFTFTGRAAPQSFKVLPIVVYKIHADGSPDELVRGVDMVGTPLSSFEKITATADDPAVFNGICGAESGRVPVSAISPSILVSSIEIEKRQRGQARPPILSPPLDKGGR